MNQTYRNYSIANENGRYVARPTDGDRLEISSIQEFRLRGGIDTLWLTASKVNKSGMDVDRLAVPLWVREWLMRPVGSIDLDDAYKRGAC